MGLTLVRALCFYLQEQGLLGRDYRAFKTASGTDPSGYAALKSVLGTDDMKAFQGEWERHVMGLRYG